MYQELCSPPRNSPSPEDLLPGVHTGLESEAALRPIYRLNLCPTLTCHSGLVAAFVLGHQPRSP